jgi:hypothetical protein
MEVGDVSDALDDLLGFIAASLLNALERPLIPWKQG